MPNAYRADHVGSFLRPPELLQARLDGTAPDRIRELEDRHILRVLARQKELGLGIFTDGELRRTNFMSDFIEAVEGLDSEDSVDRAWAASGSAPAATAATPASRVTGIVTSCLRQKRSLTAHETDFLVAHKPGPLKITLPSPTQFPAISYKSGVSEMAYATRSAFLADIVEIFKKEMAGLATANVDYIQIDAPRYSYFLDPKWRDWIRAEMGQDPDAVLDEYLRADNACFEAARRPGVILAIHLCRGNNRSQWYAQGTYDAIAEKLFRTLAVDRFLLEYDDARSGGFEPLRFVPRGKIVVLGLLSSKNPQLESRDALLARLDEASRYLPVEHLAISPQCGFASTMEGNLLSEDDQWAKVARVVEIAGEVWPKAS